MKSFELELNADSKSVIDRVMSGVKIPELISGNGIYGKQLSDNRIKLYYGTEYFKNAFRPILFVKLIDNNIKTILKGTWRFNLVSMFVICAWYGFLLFVVVSNLIKGFDIRAVLAAVVFALIMAAFIFFCVKIENKRIRMIYDYLEECKCFFDKTEYK